MSDFRIENGVLENYSGPGGNVVIPDGVTAIGNNAFLRCASLRSITIPDGVTAIGKSAFYWCHNLTSVTIPDSVTEIGDGAFYGCDKLADEQGFVIVRGILYGYKGTKSDVVIPDGVTAISDSAFRDCKGLTSITIPDSVTAIGDSAFILCESLTNITIPDGVTRIGNSAFYGCHELKEIELPAGLTTLGREAFQFCDALKRVNLPDGLTSIGARTFHYCEKLMAITIPDSVTAIGESAFSDCKRLKKVVLPARITTIGENAFFRCRSLKDVVVPDGVTSIGRGVFQDCGGLTSITLPKDLVTIGEYTFFGCEKLTSITIPDSVTDIGEHAFGACPALRNLNIPSGIQKIGKIFGGYYGSADYPANLPVDDFWNRLSDGALKEYILTKKQWNKQSADLKLDIFLAKSGKAFEKAYRSCITKDQVVPLGEGILTRLEGKPNAKECNAAAFFMTLFYGDVPVELLQRLYARLKELKTGEKAVRTLSAIPDLADILGDAGAAAESRHPAEQMVLDVLRAKHQTVKDAEAMCKTLYSLTPADLPAIQYKDGKKAAPIVFAWLLTAHEKLQECHWGQPDVVAAYEKAGICEEATKVLEELDQTEFKQALMKLADANLGLTGRSKKMFLAYPICRYADEEMMLELTKRAPKWRSSVSGNDAPPLYTFRKANAYSETRAAMMFADKYHVLDAYAKIRGTTADAIRDQFMSDVGIDEKGCKSYDLGEQTVVAELQKDLSFLIKLPNGKTAKSLPKKDSDPAKYEAANADFSEMKKAVKKIVKNRATVLFEDFLSGRERSVDGWMQAYWENPLLRTVASLLVWKQGANTFTLTDGGAVKADGSEYTVAKRGKIVVAHPMEMDADEVTAWQKYFTSRGLKQPFEQIWEPVIPADQVKQDRYAGCMIPYYRFTGQAKRGIHVDDFDFHNEINIYFDAWDAVVERIDWRRHDIEMNDRFEIKSFTYKGYSRKVNHLVAYFDRATVWERVRKDDVSVVNILHGFTLAQICEFIKVATENNCTNVAALLLEYKESHFVDFDPMVEFSLDW